MPNHVRNRIVIDATGARLKQIKKEIALNEVAICYICDSNGKHHGKQCFNCQGAKRYKRDDFGPGTIDFEKIVPPPDNLFRWGLGDEERQYCQENNIPNWYEWNIANWGTKWNAFDFDSEDGDNRLEFSTAWSAPQGIFRGLSEKYPDVQFTTEWADEDWGYNAGALIWKNGESELSDLGEIEHYSDEARGLVADLWGLDYDDPELDECFAPLDLPDAGVNGEGPIVVEQHTRTTKDGKKTPVKQHTRKR